MGLLGTAAGRMLSGAAKISNRYIDADIERQKAEALRDLQLENARRTEDYMQSPEVQERRRTNKAADVVSEGAAADTVLLNRANNRELTNATIQQKNDVTLGTADAEAEAAGKKKRAEGENTAYDLNPGGERYIGRDKIATNSRQTPQEVQQGIYADGLKGNAPKFPKEVEIQLTTISNQIKELDTEINKGIANGTLAMKPSDKNPEADAAYRTLTAKRAALEMRMNRIISDYQGGSGHGGSPKADPLGLRGGDSNGNGVGANTERDASLRAVLADMKKRGLDQAPINMQGLKGTIYADGRFVPEGAAAPGAASAPAPTAPAGPPPGPGSLLERARKAATETNPEQTPPDSPSGQFLARQQRVRDEAENRKRERTRQAQEAFAELDPDDPLSAQRLQDSELFGYLAPQQKAAVQRAVMGR